MLKTNLLLGFGLCLATPVMSQGAHIFSEGFEAPTHTVGQNPTGWSTSESAGNSAVDISAAEAFTGTQSVLLTDNQSDGNPNIMRDFGSNNASGEFTWAFKTASTNINSRIDFFPTGGNTKVFDLNWTNTTMLLRNPGGAPMSTGTLTDSSSYSATQWNQFRLVYDAATTSMRVYLNDDVNPIFTNTTFAFGPAGFGKIQVNVGYGAVTGFSGYYDAISSVPEPSSALFAGVVVGGGLLMRRRTVKR